MKLNFLKAKNHEEYFEKQNNGHELYLVSNNKNNIIHEKYYAYISRDLCDIAFKYELSFKIYENLDGLDEKVVKYDYNLTSDILYMKLPKKPNNDIYLNEYKNIVFDRITIFYNFLLIFFKTKNALNADEYASVFLEDILSKFDFINKGGIKCDHDIIREYLLNNINMIKSLCTKDNVYKLKMHVKNEYYAYSFYSSEAINIKETENVKDKLDYLNNGQIYGISTSNGCIITVPPLPTVSIKDMYTDIGDMGVSFNNENADLTLFNNCGSWVHIDDKCDRFSIPTPHIPKYKLTFSFTYIHPFNSQEKVSDILTEIFPDDILNPLLLALEIEG